MFPSKSMVDYMTEMNRLFPKPENEMLQSNAYGLPAQSPYNSTNNQSSSSTDSTSPDSFPDISTFRPNFNMQPASENSRPIFETPPPRLYDHRLVHETLETTPKSSETQFLTRRQRPIMGRKILASETPSYERVQVSPIAKIPEEYEIASAVWPDDSGLLQHTPPNVNNFFIENKNYTNVFYELFPVENKVTEFKTPVKTSPSQSTMSNVSPISNVSPSSMSRSPLPINAFHRSPSVGSSYGASSSRQDFSNQKVCTFCRKNGESSQVFLTHSVKERVGNKFVVTCPILRSHVCNICGAKGDNAHTITYCPVLRSNNNGQPLQSTTITLKNTRIKSNGKRRY